MNKLILLLKTYLLTYAGAFKRKSNKKSYLSGGVIVLLIGALFVFLFSMMAYTSIIQSIEAGMPSIALYSILCVALLFIMFITVTKGSNSNKHSDGDLLLSLPIPKFIIVLSKILKEFIFDFFIILVCVYPSAVCYYLLVPNTSPMILLTGLYIVLMLTMLSNAIAVFVKSWIFSLTKKLKFADIIQTILNVICMIAFIGFYYYVNINMNNPNGEFASKVLNLYPLKVLVGAFLNFNVQDILIIFGVCVVPFVIATIISVATFNRGNVRYKSNKKELVYKKQHVVKSLFNREVSRYFRTSLYVLNTIIGAFLMVLMSAVFLTIGDRYLGLILNQINLSNLMNYKSSLVCILLAVIASTIVTTASSVSLEGKQMWILRANPIKIKDIFHAKLLLNLVIGLVAIIISTILMCFYIDLIYIPFMLYLSIIFLCFAALNGLIADLKYGKLEWKSEAEPIKQGMNVLVAQATTLIPGIITIALFFAIGTKIDPFIFLALISLVMTIVDLALYKLLMTKGKKRFKEMI